MGFKFLLVTFSIIVMDVSQAETNYFGVGFSPYVRSDGAAWNSYTLDDIKQMLNIIATNHNAVSTYGMGTSRSNIDKNWDEVDSNCLIARAAAHINRDSKTSRLTISQGIYQQPNDADQNREIENAFKAATDANSIYPNTVKDLIFTNEFVTNESNGPKVLKMIRDNPGRTNTGKSQYYRMEICTGNTMCFWQPRYTFLL